MSSQPSRPTPSGPSTSRPGATPLEERARRVRFRRAVSLMAMTLVAPGTAQMAAGNRRVGLVAFRTWLTVLAVGAVLAVAVLLDHGLALSLGTSTLLLFWLKAFLLVGAVAWAVLLVDAWRIGQPLSYGLGHRRAAVGINGILCFSVAGTLLFGAHLVGVQRDFMLAMFGDGQASAAAHGRYNVLLMGGDSGAGRWGLRPDSLTVASIDEVTGKTVLVGLPRNMKNFPFAEGSVMAEQFPDGFDADYLNGVYTWALDHTELFEGSDDPGTDATIMAVEGITGLDINYWAMVNLQGFKDLVDAVGGVKLTVRQPIPVGLPSDDFFHYLEPGTRTLSGFDTLWYARARYDSDDYSRMARQKCVMNAMLQQVSPTRMLQNFERITKASAAMVSTSVPRSEVDTFVDLALKAKSQKVATLSLVPPLVNTGDPDVDLIHDKVAEVIAKSEGRVEKASTGSAGSSDAAKKARRAKKKAASSVTGGSLGSLSEGYTANDTEDLGTAC
ncbi:MAG: transcriptional regulator [Nocardioides sp.]|nr:transcriptional regulator [Nocardioides sp.]